VILLTGWVWFSALTNTSLPVAFKLTVAPHLAGDVIKILLAAAVLPTGWALLKRKASQKGE
jgi:biotin transporter BioY